MRSRVGLALATAAVTTLTGCADVPVLGSVGQALSGVTAPVMAALDPLIGRFLPKHDDAAAPAAPQPLRPRRRRAVAAAGQGPQAATESAQTAEARAAAAAAAWSDRNRKFDHLRTEGLSQLYGGQTAEAIKTFKEAQALRPDNAQITRLIDLCEHSAVRKELTLPGDTAKAPLPGGAPPPPPAPPANPTVKELGKLLKGANPGGDKPGDLF